MIVSEIDMFNHDLSIQSLLLYDVILYVETSRPSFPCQAQASPGRQRWEASRSTSAQKMKSLI